MRNIYSEIDQAIRRHGEPHVVRVSIVCTLIPGVDKEILFISIGAYLSEYLEVVVWTPITRPTEYSSMNEYLSCSGWNDAGDSE